MYSIERLWFLIEGIIYLLLQKIILDYADDYIPPISIRMCTNGGIWFSTMIIAYGIPTYGLILMFLTGVLGIVPVTYYSFKRPSIMRKDIKHYKDPVCWILGIGILTLFYVVINYYLLEN